MKRRALLVFKRFSVVAGVGYSLNRLLLVHNSNNKMTDSPPPEFYPQERVRNMSIFIGDMRIPYMNKDEAFTEDQLVSKEPFAQFNNWFERAAQTQGIEEPNAMCLATATKDGRPSARMVLMKGYGPDGFKFFTNYTSRKAIELSENPYASLNFYWEPMKRCVSFHTIEKYNFDLNICVVYCSFFYFCVKGAGRRSCRETFRRGIHRIFYVTSCEQQNWCYN